MTTYNISNIEIDSFNSHINSIILDSKEIIIKLDDSNTSFEEREEMIGEKMCEVLGLNPQEYSVNCTYEVVESDCDHTWLEEEEE